MNDGQTERPRCDEGCPVAPLDRRSFLLGAGATVTSLMLPECAVAVEARVATYPRRKIGKLAGLLQNKPQLFRYPWEHEQCENFLVRLDRPAAGGVGPGQSVVAFNRDCTHQGWAMDGAVFRSDAGIAGPCPWHLTTFDLTRHGMVISGHATQGLPQILLVLEGDDLIATGVMGLLFGLHDNRVSPT